MFLLTDPLKVPGRKQGRKEGGEREGRKERRRGRIPNKSRYLGSDFALELPVSFSRIQMNFENPLRSDNPKCKNDKRLWPW